MFNAFQSKMLAITDVDAHVLIESGSSGIKALRAWDSKKTCYFGAFYSSKSN
jgi:hypothetical protein